MPEYGLGEQDIGFERLDAISRRDASEIREKIALALEG
jgi:hypothetical protein